MKRLKNILFVIFSIACFTANAQSIGGIGAQLKLDTAKDGSTLPLITGVLAYSPADAKNIAKDSYILRVNDYDCKNKPLEDVVKNIRGEVGTSVKLLLADNPEGKKAKEYTLVRATIAAPPAPPTQPAADPTTVFYNWCDQQVGQIRKQGHAILKKFTSDCGSFFFSFESEGGPCSVRLMLLEEKGANAQASASLYDNSNEAGAVALKTINTHENGNSVVRELEATITVKSNGVGVIKVNAPDGSKCKGMYIVAYK